METKKRLILFVLAAVCLASAGCGKKNVRTSDESSDVPGDTPSVSDETSEDGENRDKSSGDTDDKDKIKKNNASGDKDSSESEKDGKSPGLPAPTEKTEVRAPDGGDPILVSVSTPAGDVISKYSTAQDIDLNRPQQLGDNEVFTGWKEQKTVTSIEDGEPVSGDVLTLTPETSDIADKKNTVYNNAIYSRIGSSDEISVPLRIGGDTDFCVLDLEVKYDPSVLEFVRFDNTDPCNTINCDEEESTILMSFLNIDNVKADTLLTEVVFRPKAESFTRTKFFYNVKDIATFDSSANDLADTEYNVVQGSIVMY